MSDQDEQGRQIWDISQRLIPGIPVWPGDNEFEQSANWVINESCPVNVAKLSLSTHCGTHADGPLHYDPTGLPIGLVALDAYLGTAQVIHVLDHHGVIEQDHVMPKLDPKARRVLLRSFRTFPSAVWRDDFAALSPSLIEALGSRQVLLVGTDAPSLDPQTAKDLKAHQAICRHGMAILEGLVLDAVPEGLYELIALPLPLDQTDASPVRAILRSLP